MPFAYCSFISCPVFVLAVHSRNADFSSPQINVSFFIVPNAYVLYNRCGVFAELVAVSGIIRWTCWNTVSISVALLMPQLKAHSLPAAVFCSRPAAAQARQIALPNAMHAPVPNWFGGACGGCFPGCTADVTSTLLAFAFSRAAMMCCVHVLFRSSASGCCQSNACMPLGCFCSRYY